MGDFEPVETVHMGGHLGQMGAVRHAEDLQDFRREREGHLLIRDDGPILIISFGAKYQGANVSKFMIEGKYHIPVDYKSIVKWEEDEVVFMTRAGVFGPEYQIMYLPKSAVADDFTLFEWNANINEVWDMLLTVLETQEMDMTMWEKGPWFTFGVTEDTVQIAVERGLHADAVEGILYCMRGSEPSFNEYAQYLGLLPDEYDKLEWVVTFFSEEPMPTAYSRCPAAYIEQEQKVYWITQDTQESTWTHPLFDKYRRMLLMARNKKPVAHWRSLMAFQIDFLFQTIFTWQMEQSGEFPPVETIENVREMARIFKADLDEEPYMGHVLKRALRHYAQCVKAKRPIGEVDDFRALMQRYRDVVNNFGVARDIEQAQTQALVECVECVEGSKKTAVLYCDVCQDLFCQTCFDRLHSKGRRRDHKRTWVELGVCIECEESLATFHCVQCQDAFCRECFQEWHVRGGRRNHVPIILRHFSVENHRVPSTGTFRDGRLSTAALCVGSAASVNLRKCLCHWMAFEDETQIPIYHNLREHESRRDRPPVINEPIEDLLGGGYEGAWAGSYVALENDLADKTVPVAS